MAIKVQYNKTFLQYLQKQLKVRENALPTLQAKEAALRLEVKKALEQVKEVRRRLEEKDRELEKTYRLWPEFPEGLVSIKDIVLDIKKIAGVKTPIYKKAVYEVRPHSLFGNPAWIPEGVELLKAAAGLRVERMVAEKKVEILEFARKKTTQKVNLYEKVQIPEYNSAILSIKRFLEDQENLAKSSQKILKTRLAASEAA
ncbi:MAG: V-type ATP synthase subunit D [Chitinivibrionales bacterium]|nr:V-type ATP synthase subunit D [Chitinivibrionales bacterium]MBD3357527.1 V-type ATP synthase subunit D [Chitinivibrionales bacterium]